MAVASTGIGTLETYNGDDDSWVEYIERMEHYFDANGITGSKKKSVLLTVVGAKTYKLIKTLLAPNKPGDKSFEEIVCLVKQHECPKPSAIVQRFKFNSRKQQAGESVADFVADLRLIAEHCNYDSKLEEMLRDRIVCGIQDIRTQRRLLSEKGLDFTKALEIAQALETAAKHANDLQEYINEPTTQHHRANKLLSGDKRKSYKHKAKPKFQGCYRCGSKEHNAHECRHKDTVCHNCGLKGHLVAVCRKPKGWSKDKRPAKHNVEKGHRTHELDETNQSNSELIDTLSVQYDMYVLKQRPDEPLRTRVEIHGKQVTMEIDTGAAVSVMSETTFNKLWPEGTVKMVETSAFLRTYTGENVKVLGKCDVQVSSMGTKAYLPLLIVPGDHSTLLGRNWLNHLQVDWGKIKRLRYSSVESITQQHPDLFKDELGTIKGVKAKIYLKDGATPRYFKARPVPFALKDKIECELQRLQDNHIISPVEFSEWAAPIVPIVKGDGTIRICGDYKVTVNRGSQVDSYPLPQIEDLLATLSGGKIFSKLDLSHAYQQIELEDESKEMVTINTHKGLFKQNRLPFGVSSAPGIFQRTMDSLIQGLPGVVGYLDDVLVTGASLEEHASNLEGVLQRFDKAGVRLKKEKCVFGVSEVTYLGYKIDAAGLHPVEDKVQAVLKAPSPTNVTELKAYLGLLNYYGRFLPSLSTLLAPLHVLLKQNTEWVWTASQEDAFQKSKQLLLNSKALAHYDPSKALLLACDASPYGVGIVLSHRMDNGEERPIAFASRSLTTAEKRYSQLDKEGLAIVFGVKKFHKYIFGRSVTIYTDHKPLLGILGESRGIPQMASARLVRWALTLSAYNYTLKYKAGSKHQNADALSRLPLHQPEVEVPLPGDVIMLMEYIDSSPIETRDIEKWSKRDPVLSKVYHFIQNGWETDCKDDNLSPYFKRSAELSNQEGIILWGSRVVIPPQGRKAILRQLHEGHPGISRIKQIARSFVWWPGMDQQLEQTVKDCQQCQLHRKLPASAPLNPWPWPEKPWSRIHVDFAGPFKGKMIMIVVDSHSKWIEAVPMDTSTSQATIGKLRSIFATHGLPDMVVTDNGSNFTSSEFADFLKKNGVKHVRTAPYHPASNGLAERAVQTVKDALRKMSSGSMETKLARFLFHYRNTPHTTTGQTPSQLLMGRKVKTHMDLLKPDLGATVRYKQALQKEQHDANAKDRIFIEGDPVFVRDVVNRKWLPGVITDCTGPVSYIIRLEDGRIVRRHQDHIRFRTGSTQFTEKDLEGYAPRAEIMPAHTTVQPVIRQHPVSDISDKPTEPVIENETISNTPQLRRSKRVIKPRNVLDL